VLSGLFALSVLLAFGLYLGPVWGVGTALVSLATTAAIFAAAAADISIDETRLHAGRASIELTYLGEAIPLATEDARRRRGPEADARAFLVLRPYISTAVEVRIADPDDPAPYWLLASRRPRALAAALTTAVERAGLRG
jgi:hypothetical protein